MLELTKENYDAEVINSKATVVVDFWGDTCVRCKQLMPGMEEMERDFEGRAVFARVNIQGNRRLAMKEHVMSLPSVIIYREGERKELLTGNSFTTDDVRAKLTEVLDA